MLQIKNKTGLISVIMPVYNAESFLDESISSVLNQSYESFELLILNDNSTDNSLPICEKYANTDNRIKLINSTKNIGAAGLRNKGIEIAEGEFIAFMDADDIANEYRFEKQLNIFKQNDEIGVCGSWFTQFGEQVKRKKIKHLEFHDQIISRFLINCSIGNSTAMFRKKNIGNIKHNEELKIAIDYDFWSRLILKTKFYNIQESLIDYRIHKNNISTTKKKDLKSVVTQIKLFFLEQLEIKFDELKEESFINLLETEKHLKDQQIKEVIYCGLVIIEANKKNKIYEDTNLKKVIYNLTTRVLKQSKSIKITTLYFVKKKNPEYYKKISFINKIKLYKKVLFNCI